MLGLVLFLAAATRPLIVKWAQTADSVLVTVPRGKGCTDAQAALETVESVTTLHVSTTCNGEEVFLFDMQLEKLAMSVTANKGRGETRLTVVKYSVGTWEQLTPLQPQGVKVDRDWGRGNDDEEEEVTDSGVRQLSRKGKVSSLPATEETLKHLYLQVEEATKKGKPVKVSLLNTIRDLAADAKSDARFQALFGHALQTSNRVHEAVPRLKAAVQLQPQNEGFNQLLASALQTSGGEGATQQVGALGPRGSTLPALAADSRGLMQHAPLTTTPVPFILAASTGDREVQGWPQAAPSRSGEDSFQTDALRTAVASSPSRPAFICHTADRAWRHCPIESSNASVV